MDYLDISNTVDSAGAFRAVGTAANGMYLVWLFQFGGRENLLLNFSNVSILILVHLSSYVYHYTM